MSCIEKPNFFIAAVSAFTVSVAASIVCESLKTCHVASDIPKSLYAVLNF